MARRLVERGVRFVQLYHGGLGNQNTDTWDAHENVKANHTKHAAEVDRPDRRSADRPEVARAARLDSGDLARRVRPHADLAARRRTRPQSGRDEYLDGRSATSRAARSSARATSSATRRRSSRSPSTTCTPRSCTCSGMDHTRLTYRFNGRDMRLTDVYGEPVAQIVQT